ncbi:hypothetical protein BHE74_00006901 [Ensete ventricosum]|nr:hypothetical protein BHE74_00006901 [Ensete ventricosum]
MVVGKLFQVVELNERLTTLGIAVNLVTYLTGTMHLGNAASANTVTNFMGTSFMLCLLGGFVADTFLGRYLTIAIFAAVQASVSTTATSISKPLSSSATGLSTVFDGIDMQGVSILTISTAVPGLRPPACTDLASGGCVKASGAQLEVLYLALYLTALGTGGLKSSVSGFGSDQFDETDPGEKAQMMKFFNWFFFFISLGSLLAVTVLVYIQDNLGREWGYGLCATAIALGLVVFLSGTWRYRFKKLVGSPLTQIAVVVAAAWRKRGLELPSDPSLLHDIDERQAATDAEKGSKRSNAKQRVPHTKQFRYALNSSLLSCCRHLVPTFPLIMVSRVVSCFPHISIRIMNLSFPALLVLLRTHMKKKKKKKRGGMDSGNISQDPGHGLTLLCVGAFRCHAFGKRAPRAGYEKAADTKKKLIEGDGRHRTIHWF